MKRLLIQVVSQLKPERCGVSDNALLLARELEIAYGISTAFIVLNSTEQCDQPFARIYCPPRKLLQSCNSLSEGRQAALLVHCSGYGYSTDGAPTLLADALKQVRNSGQFRIGTYFHELYATGMPWRSAFWYSHRQRRALRKIAAESDLIVTNTSYHFEWLKHNALLGSSTPLLRMPVFSNVGENEQPLSVGDRRPAMIIFGLPSTRRRAYKLASSLRGMLHCLGIEEILDIGPECETPASLGGIPVRRIGALDASDLALLLSETRFGLVSHEPICLAKSGVFAGFCAHGTIPIIAESFQGEMDGLSDGIHVISPQKTKDALAYGLQNCSAASWNWYLEHRVHVHALTYSQLLLSPTEKDDTDICMATRTAHAQNGYASGK
ncbi:MAG: hypothetical protein P4K97_00385 [Terracidiphilus sp.]|nr:hypothetical protein [Terracidiphilus sp.]